MGRSEKDLVSVIIPVYNVAPFLERCMKSILSQSYSNLEIILIDDGSTDNSGHMCDDFGSKDDRIRIVHQENRGLSASRNVGTLMSKGNYVCFIDPDDEVDTRYIETLYEAIKTCGASMAICSYTSIFTEDKMSMVSYPCERAVTAEVDTFAISTDEYIHSIINRKCISVTAWSRLYTAELAREVLFPEGRVYEDWATHIQFAICAKQIAIVRQSLYIHYKQRADSITETISDQNTEDFLWAYRTAYDQIIHYDPKLKKRADWIISEAPLLMMVNICMKRNKQVNSSIYRELRDQIKHYLLQGTYRSFKVRLKAVLVLLMPRLVPSLWKMRVTL